MATLVLSAAGGNVGGSIGQYVGSRIGALIDNAVFGDGGSTRQGGRLSNLAIQDSAYGEMIPIIYGNVRIAGNVIWAKDIKETATISTATAGGGKGGGGSVSQRQTNYNYSITLAIAVCEGEIDEVVRVWADAEVINPDEIAASYSIYTGSEDQLPDSIIESYEGVGSTPAYRGLAYVVLEDFPLGDYGNRIPNFTFEVKKKLLPDDNEGESLEEMIKSMVLIPGSGEFVYDDTVQYKIPGEEVNGAWVQLGNKSRINQHNRQADTDALLALDNLESTCPNVEWVSVVVGWFGTDLDAGECTILPGVEFDTSATTDPDVWAVGSYGRSSAYLISQDENGSPVYGGTPSDASLLRYLTEIKSRGYNILFYPMFFMDTEGKPWRGRVTGSASDVADFFTKTSGYNAFIIHYANLVAEYVDGFVIGSELVGLNAVQDDDDSFPAVDALVSLAATVKGIVGSSVKVTYAADWSEYHHDANGWYHLDPLWASDNIDVVGIDAYFPLTDSVQPVGGFELQDVIDGWTSGEGYDWYYSDEERSVQTALADAYAWKNIAWWWSNTHTNPDDNETDWVPESKPIWFTEYGFPSVDGATNQPNVFYDPNSSESYFPYYSKGTIDFSAQRLGILATEKKWLNSAMIERMFLWTWDARPYPFWPDLTNVWSDGQLWYTGHWVQGKLGTSGLSAIASDICERVGLSSSDIDTTRLTGLVDGFMITSQATARKALDILRSAFFFDAVESGGVIKFVPRGSGVSASIEEEELIPQGSKDKRSLLTITRQQELELPQKVDVVYINRHADYQTGNQHSQRLASGINSVDIKTLNLPIVMEDAEAKYISDVALYNSWLARTRYQFYLPPSYAALEPSDVIEITTSVATHTLRITSTQLQQGGMVRVEGVAEDISTYDFSSSSAEIDSQTTSTLSAPATRLVLMDLPAFPSDGAGTAYLRIAMAGEEDHWEGANLYRSDDGGANYSQVISTENASVIGAATTQLGSGSTEVFDEGNSVTVSLIGEGTLESVSRQAVLNGGNVALLGDEVIQFRNATLVSEGQYTLSGLLRGRLGTEWAVDSHEAGETFVLLDNRLEKETASLGVIGLSRNYAPVSIGDTLANTTTEDFTYQGRALKPYAPVHISGERDEGGNLTISWVRRTRIGGEWRDSVDALLSEDSEAYEVDIMNGETVVRTLSELSTTEASYTAAEQTTDFGSAQGSVTVNIYQISASVGRGWPGEGVV